MVRNPRTSVLFIRRCMLYISFFDLRDINSLARAAVSGDESALEMFNWKSKGKNKGGNPFGPQESMSFFIGGASGETC